MSYLEGFIENHIEKHIEGHRKAYLKGQNFIWIIIFQVFINYMTF